MEKHLPKTITGLSRFIKTSRLITSGIVPSGMMNFSFNTNVHYIGSAEYHSAGSIINIGNSDSSPVN